MLGGPVPARERAVSTVADTRPLMASARSNWCRLLFQTHCNKESIHEAFGCGTGGSDVLRCLTCTRHYSARAGDDACSCSVRHGAVVIDGQVRHDDEKG